MEMKRKAFIYSILVTFVFVLLSCSRNDPDVIAERDREKILEYIEENELDAMELEEGVFIAITQEGSGGNPSENSLVLLNYIGTLLNGDVFDSGNSARLNLAAVVRGFRIGVMELNRGSKAIILIPSAAGYGQFSQAGIPRNSVLIFDVEIIDF